MHAHARWEPHAWRAHPHAPALRHPPRAWPSNTLPHGPRVRALYANGTIRHIAGSGAGPLPEAIDNAAPAATAAIYHPLGMAFEPGRPGVRGPGLWLGSETLLRRIDLGNSPPLVYTMSGDDGTAGCAQALASTRCSSHACVC